MSRTVLVWKKKKTLAISKYFSDNDEEDSLFILKVLSYKFWEKISWNKYIEIEDLNILLSSKRTIRQQFEKKFAKF